MQGGMQKKRKWSIKGMGREGGRGGIWGGVCSRFVFFVAFEKVFYFLLFTADGWPQATAPSNESCRMWILLSVFVCLFVCKCVSMLIWAVSVNFSCCCCTFSGFPFARTVLTLHISMVAEIHSKKRHFPLDYKISLNKIIILDIFVVGLVILNEERCQSESRLTDIIFKTKRK